MKWLSAEKQRGMTLLEVVVSMLIIGLGMSASIAMLQASMQNNIAALNRNNAIYLSNAIIDKMRMNKFAAKRYLYGNSDVNIDSEKPGSPENCDFCDNTNPNQTGAFTQAGQDIDSWYDELQGKLPGAGFAIYEIDATGPTNPTAATGRYAIKLKWPNRVDRSRIETGSKTSKSEDTDSLETIFTL